MARLNGAVNEGFCSQALANFNWRNSRKLLAFDVQKLLLGVSYREGIFLSHSLCRASVGLEISGVAV